MREKIAIALLCVVALAGCSTYNDVHDYVYGPPRFIVFFAGDSATLTPDAKVIVKTAAARITTHHPATVIIAAGVVAGDNMELSEPRFAVVHDELVADGVSSDLIARAPIPGPKLAETTAKPGTSTADQRVEIRLLDKAP